VLFYILNVESGQKVKQQPVKALPEKKADASKTIAVAQPAPVPKRPESRAPSKILLAMQIISEESGVAVDDLTDASSFADMGIDSLLSLNIVARFREELELEIDYESIFLDFPTVRDLKGFLAPEGEEETREVVPQDNSQNAKPTDAVPLSEPVAAADTDFLPSLQIISEESGVSVDDLTEDSSFADMGIDSLLSLVIVSRFREELGLEIDSDSIFLDCPTVGTLKEFITGVSSSDDQSTALSGSGLSLGKEQLSSAASDVTHVEDKDGDQSTPLSISSSSSVVHIDKLCSTPRQATSVILQGLPVKCQKTLFLFPDGSGSSTSYASLPRISSDIAVIGLNSPYLKEPVDMRTCSVDDLIEGYLQELRRRQPNGPYDLGGWSAGGILAYRAAQTLIDQGEEVLSLVLIDSPVPKGLDRLPEHFYDFCGKLNLFGHGGGPSSLAKPEWLIPHFNATIDVLHDFYAEPLLEEQCPKVSIIWACDSVMDGPDVPKLPPHPDDTEGMKFLTEKRNDFSANGWEELFPGVEIAIKKVEGATHFSMMVSRSNPPQPMLSTNLNSSVATMHQDCPNSCTLLWSKSRMVFSFLFY